MNNENNLCFMVKYNQLPLSIRNLKTEFSFHHDTVRVCCVRTLYIASDHRKPWCNGLEFWFSLFLEFMSNISLLAIVMSNSHSVCSLVYSAGVSS